MDKEMTRQKRKILLIIDNCPAHPVVENLQSLRLVFLPPNTTSHTQPMDAGVIRCFKAHYRNLLMTKMIRELDAGRNFTPDLYQAITLAAQAWESVSQQTMQNCFRHCGFVHETVVGDTGQELEEAIQDFGNIFEKLAQAMTLAPGVTATSYLSADDQTAICARAKEDDIVQTVVNSTLEEDVTAVEDNDDCQPQVPVKASEEAAAIDILQLFIVQQGMDAS